MNIGLYHSTLPDPCRKMGGVEVFCHRFANELVKRGHEVTVYSLTRCAEGALYQHVQLLSIFESTVKSKLFRLFIAPILLNIVRFGKHDVLHLHGDDWFYIRRAIPTVRTLHGSAKFEANYATSWRRRVMQRIVYPLEHLSRRLATVSTAVGSEAAGIYKTEHISDIGIDMQLFRPGAKSEKPRLLFVGTIDGRKRGRLMRDVFLKEVLPGCPECELVMVADFELEAHPAITYLKKPSDVQLAEYYRSAWIFCYPSSYEGFGMSYIESLASGTPIVTTRNSGAEYVLADGKYGRIVSDLNFGLEILKLIGSESDRIKLGEDGIEYVQKFSWPNVCSSYLSVFETARNGNRLEVDTGTRL